jgi:hypothetical protein
LTGFWEGLDDEFCDWELKKSTEKTYLTGVWEGLDDELID